MFLAASMKFLAGQPAQWSYHPSTSQPDLPHQHPPHLHTLVLSRPESSVSRQPFKKVKAQILNPYTVSDHGTTQTLLQ